MFPSLSSLFGSSKSTDSSLKKGQINVMSMTITEDDVWTMDQLTDYLEITIPTNHPDLKPIHLQTELDIINITNQIYVMGSPWHQRTETQIYRNNFNEVQLYLKRKKYMIFNLSNIEYPDIFKVVNHEFHYILTDIFQIVRAIAGWIHLSSNHIALIHCKNGVKHTSLIMSALLRYLNIFDSAIEAFDFFILRRSPFDQDWISNKHRRYVNYINDIFQFHGQVPNPQSLILKKLILNTVPCTKPAIEVLQNNRQIYFGSENIFVDEFNIVISLQVECDQDIQIKLYQQAEQQLVNLAKFTFNTGFMGAGLIRLPLKELEYQRADFFSPDFSVDIVFMQTESKKLNYQNYIDQYITKECLALSHLLPVQVDPNLADILHKQGFKKIAYETSLKLARNDLHLATEYLHLLFKPLQEKFIQEYIRIGRKSLQQHQIDKVINRQSLNFIPEQTEKEKEIERKAEAEVTFFSPKEEPKIVTSPEKDIVDDFDAPESSSLFSDTPHISEDETATPDAHVQRKQLKLHSKQMKEESDTIINENNQMRQLEEQLVKEEQILKDEQESRSKKRIKRSQIKSGAFKQIDVLKNDQIAEYTVSSPSKSDLPPPPPPLPPMSGSGPPPPPPIPGPNGAPPPPPPPGGLAAAPDLSNKPRIRNKVQFDQAKANRHSIWAQEDDDEEIVEDENSRILKGSSMIALDLNKFEDLFCVTEDTVKTPVIKKEEEKPSVVTILDVRKANNISIGLAQFKKFSFEELRSEIATFKITNIDQLNSLLMLMPTQDDLKLIHSFINAPQNRNIPISDYNTAEQFLLTINQDPNIERFIEIQKYMLTSRQQISDLSITLQEINKTCRDLQESGSLKTLLKTVLNLGNLASYDYNIGYTRKKLTGFKINNLLKLNTIRSSDSKSNLLNYLCLMTSEACPELLELPDEFSNLLKLSQINTKELLSEIEFLDNELTKIEKFVPLPVPMEISQKYGEFDSKSHLKNFVDSLIDPLNALLELEHEYDDIWVKTALYFGEDVEDSDISYPEQLFSILHQFFQMMKIANEENQRIKELEKRRIAKEKERKAKRRQGSVGSTNVLELMQGNIDAKFMGIRKAVDGSESDEDW
eukprot:NODE_25_length_41203_cov_0.917113.p3 type:complete len:1101 gc:universal NODE_25_length_41203_cov_0.917113:30220-26918(-)